MSAHILIVEDDPAQRELLAYNVGAQGWRVSAAASGDEGLDLIAEDPPDLVLLDWMLPGTSGIEVCRRLKARRGQGAVMPVLMLSARGEEADRIRGLDTGADDYLVKPYSVAELMARIRAHLRRTKPLAAGEVLTFGDLSLDPGEHRVRRKGRELHLGPVEFRLLSTFMERPGRVLSRDQLLDLAWGREEMLDTRTVDVHVGRLRKTLGDPDPIRTVRGAGYALG
jgi:two-component system, OmpR family, phosphate regulon response regulator PhoB